MSAKQKYIILIALSLLVLTAPFYMSSVIGKNGQQSSNQQQGNPGIPSQEDIARTLMELMLEKSSDRTIVDSACASIRRMDEAVAIECLCRWFASERTPDSIKCRLLETAMEIYLRDAEKPDGLEKQLLDSVLSEFDRLRGGKYSSRDGSMKLAVALINSLGDIGARYRGPEMPGGIIERLMAAANEKYLRRASLQSMGKIGPASTPAIPMLVNIALSDRDCGYNALSVIGSIGPNAIAAKPVLEALMAKWNTDWKKSIVAARSHLLVCPSDRTPVKKIMDSLLSNTRGEPDFAVETLVWLGEHVEDELEAERNRINQAHQGQGHISAPDKTMLSYINTILERIEENKLSAAAQEKQQEGGVQNGK